MNKLEKYLTKKGIIGECTEVDDIYGVDEYLVSIDNNFIVTVVYSWVLEPELKIYDTHTLALIGGQHLEPDDSLPFGEFHNKWASWLADEVCNY